MSRNVQKDKNEDKSPLVGACCRLLTYNVCYFPHLCYSELWSLKIGDCNLNTCLIISKGTCIAMINLLVHGKIKESYRNNSNSYEVAHSSQHNLSWFTCYSPEVQETQIFFVCFLHSTGSKYSCTAIGIIHAHIAVNLSDGCSRTHVPTQISFSYLEDDQYLSEQ